MSEEEAKVAKEAEEKAKLLEFMKGFQKVKKLEEIHGDAGEEQKNVHKMLDLKERVKNKDAEKAKEQEKQKAKVAMQLAEQRADHEGKIKAEKAERAKKLGRGMSGGSLGELPNGASGELPKIMPKKKPGTSFRRSDSMASGNDSDIDSPKTSELKLKKVNEANERQRKVMEAQREAEANGGNVGKKGPSSAIQIKGSSKNAKKKDFADTIHIAAFGDVGVKKSSMPGVEEGLKKRKSQGVSIGGAEIKTLPAIGGGSGSRPLAKKAAVKLPKI